MHSCPPLPVMTQRISQEIGRQQSDFRGRVIQWSIQAVIANGVPKDEVLALLDGKTVDRHWWHIRQMLPEEAIRSLYFKVVGEFGQIFPQPCLQASATPFPALAAQIHASPEGGGLLGDLTEEFDRDEWEDVA